MSFLLKNVGKEIDITRDARGAISILTMVIALQVLSPAYASSGGGSWEN